MQELRDLGEISFRAKVDNRTKKQKRVKVGQYTTPSTNLVDVANHIESILDGTFQIESHSSIAEPPNKFANYLDHRFEFHVLPVESPGAAETIAQAVQSLAKFGYAQETGVAIFVQVTDEDGDELDFRWVSLTYGASPRVAGGQVEFAFDEYAAKGKYRVTEQISIIGIRTREP